MCGRKFLFFNKTEWIVYNNFVIIMNDFTPARKRAASRESVVQSDDVVSNRVLKAGARCSFMEHGGNGSGECEAHS